MIVQSGDVWRCTETSTPGIVWARYADALGADTVKAWFGRHWPPLDRRPGEHVFVWRLEGLDGRPSPVFDPTDHPAGWLSLAPDQFNPSSVWMSRGVWPEWHGRGLGRLMRDHAERWVRGQGASSLDVIVNAANALHLANVLADPYWTMDAVLFDGPAFGFVHKVAP